MVSTNDPRESREKFRKEKERIENHEPEADRDWLRKWADNPLQHLAFGTGYNYLNRVRRLSESADKPLSHIENAGEATRVITDFAGDYTEGTQRNYRIALKEFFDYHGQDWAGDIHIGEPPDDEEEITRDDVHTRKECDALLAAVDHPRDRALITTLLATGQRITALLSLRVGSVSFEGEQGQNGTIYLNNDAVGLKGASGPRPLLWATEDVRRWLRQHPRRGDDDAPLFCTIRSGSGGKRSYEKGDPLSQQQVRRRLRAVAERTETLNDHDTVDPDKAGKPHNYRHSAITRMVREGVDEQQIKWLVGWEEDSGQLGRYSHVTDEEFMAQVRQSHGKDDEADTEVIGRPTVDECPECGADARIGTGSCEECGALFTQQSASNEDGEGTVFECVQCDRSISQTDAFCRYCGADQRADPEEQPDPVEEQVKEVVAELFGADPDDFDPDEMSQHPVAQMFDDE